MLYKLLILPLVWCLFSFSLMAADNACHEPLLRPKVMLIIPAPKDSVFWNGVAQVARATSKQLGIDLKTYYFDIVEGQRYSFPQYLDDLLEKEPDTQYLVSKFVNKIEKKIISVTKKHNVKLLTFNSELTQSIQANIGVPRLYYPHWLLHIESNEISTGYDLANFLISEAQKNSKNINLLAFNGNVANEVAGLRATGLMRRVEEDDNIKLLQVISTDWTYAQTRRKAAILLKRFQEINAVWCASDEIARGVVDEVKQSRPDLLNQLAVGGIDWSFQVFPYLADHSINVSYGGHLFDITYLLILLYDYHNNNDFEVETTTFIQNKNYPLFGSVNQILYQNKYDDLDFKALSKCHSKKLPKYNFNISQQLK